MNYYGFEMVSDVDLEQRLLGSTEIEYVVTDSDQY